MGFDMPCFHPIDCWRPVGFQYGKKSMYFGVPPQKVLDFGRVETFKIPCGVCVGCRIDRSKEWALRCVLEAKQYPDNCFITLTYDDSHLPPGGSLDFDALQLFFKRLRKKVGYEKIRYYAVGEYGAKLARPHFHAILFGYDFPDKWLWSCERGQKLFRSASLESIWTYGYSSVGAVTFESCAYVARYVQKKLYRASGEDLVEHYGGKAPEAARMSRRPGIAAGFFEKYKGDIYPKDYIVFHGRKYKPGRFFDYLYHKEHPEELLQLKVERMVKALEKVDDSTPDRLATREALQELRVSRLVRGFEVGNN